MGVGVGVDIGDGVEKLGKGEETNEDDIGGDRCRCRIRRKLVNAGLE